MMKTCCNSTNYRKANKLSQFRRMKYVLNQFAFGHKKRGSLYYLSAVEVLRKPCNQISNAETHAVIYMSTHVHLYVFVYNHTTGIYHYLLLSY